MPTTYYNKYILLGIIGALIILYGHIFHNTPQIYYIIGSFALLTTAIYYKLVYFIALEFILIAGHSAILMGIGPYIQVALPILLCLQLFIVFFMIGKEQSLFLLIGIIGIALLSIGFTYNNQWIFFLGSLFISIYAYYNGYKRCAVAYIWAVLNTLFALIALYELFL